MINELILAENLMMTKNITICIITNYKWIWLEFVHCIINLKLAPAVCYESVYGDFMAKYIRSGAEVICIITNDGWWGNTPGHRQHLAYAKLRAIETRKQIIRSANTGISCFV